MAHQNLVLKPVNLAGETICVDLFQCPDGSFGFDEFRRDPEDGRGWYSIGHHGDARFGTLADAKAEALRCIGWLEPSMLN